MYFYTIYAMQMHQAMHWHLSDLFSYCSSFLNIIVVYIILQNVNHQTFSLSFLSYLYDAKKDYKI